MKKVAFYDRFCVTYEITETFRQLNIEPVLFKGEKELSEILSTPDNGINSVMGINFHGNIHEVCCNYDIPYVVWTFDSGTFGAISGLEKDKLREKDFLFLFNRRDFMECSKFHKNTYYLPFSASSTFEKAPLETGFSFDVLSVMNTYTRTVELNENIFLKTLDSKNNPLEKKGLQLIKSLMELVVERHKYIFDKNLMFDFLNEYIRECGIDLFDPKRLKIMCENYGQILSCIQRELCVTELCKTGSKVDVFGDYCWEKILESFPNAVFHSNAEYLQLPGFYNSAKINLNLNQIQNLNCIPQRIFHLLASGGFALTNYFDELHNVFKPGIHFETFRDPEELKSKTVYYLKNDDLRLKIAMAGHKEFIEKHRMTSKISFIFSKIEKKS